ncbi:hypothetical protein [Bacillus litorisediminis]|uniref:hypothetical protein n=1 Tax=Bacillus litorisediminis TaxID=2922713 RepID=UPI001FAECD82|nr:hypothetical protein [Bacillus litorisediminis]
MESKTLNTETIKTMHNSELIQTMYDLSQWLYDEENQASKDACNNLMLDTIGTIAQRIVKLVDDVNIAESENDGWSTIVYEFIEQQGLFKEFADHLRVNKEDYENAESVSYFFDFDYVLLDYEAE